MNKQTKSLDQLKDGRLLYDKDLPYFGYAIILILIVLLAVVITWSIHTPKVEMITSSGIIQSTNKNYVMSPYAGEIVSCKLTEGISVQKGDILATIKSTDLELQAEQLLGQKEVYVEKVKQLDRLVVAIQSNKNIFDPNKESESLYYNQYETYQSQVAQNQLDTTTYKSYGYTDEQIEVEVKKNEAKIAEIYHSTLQTIQNSIDEASTQIANIEVQVGTVNSGQQEYQILASESGVIHMMAEYKAGMVVQAGNAIASIASEQDEYKIVANVSVSDRARITIGDSVDVVIAGLVQTIYGTISGEVMRIDSDITSDSESGESYFKVEIIPDSNYLISKDGNKVNISNGMVVETRIQYDEITYFNYVLEALGVLTR
ncbi:MAG: HlyD family efflux transporter periplasmic adaptor subunit [bacterium]|nr:HlyD family efflux transporter periplasmic adaptor subunit [bacterium]